MNDLTSTSWPPVGLALPDTIEAIEAGRPELVRTAVDDSRGGRLVRLAGESHKPFRATTQVVSRQQTAGNDAE